MKFSCISQIYPCNSSVARLKQYSVLGYEILRLNVPKSSQSGG